jgi:hypothetical protein
MFKKIQDPTRSGAIVILEQIGQNCLTWAREPKGENACRNPVGKIAAAHR